MLTKQDTKIIECLMEYEKLSAYSISKHTKISQPQVMYRIGKMLDCGFISQNEHNGKRLFLLHPLMANEEFHEEVLKKFLDLAHLFEHETNMNLDSLRYYIEFFMFSIQEDDNNNSSTEKRYKELNYP